MSDLLPDRVAITRRNAPSRRSTAPRFTFEEPPEGTAVETARLDGRDADLARSIVVRRVAADASDAAMARFVETAQIVAQLQHPGVFPVYELGLDRDDRPYVIVPPANGVVLRDALTDNLPESNEFSSAASVFGKICQAVAYCHDRGVLHDNLTIDTIVIGRWGEVQIDGWDQCRAVGPYSIELRRDVRSLGNLLAELTNGLADTAREDEQQVTRWISRCADDSPPSAAELAAEVSTFLAEIEGRAHRLELAAAESEGRAEVAKVEITRMRTANEAARKKRRQWTVAAVIVSLTLTAAAWAFHDHTKAERDRRRRFETRASEALRDAESAAGESAWSQALGAIERASTLARTEAIDSSLVARIDRARERIAEERRTAIEAAAAKLRRVEAIARLHELRTIRALTDESRDTSILDRRFADALEAVGVTLDVPRKELDPGVDVETVIAALDHWAWLRRPGDAARRALVCAQRLDPNSERRAWRASELNETTPLSTEPASPGAAIFATKWWPTPERARHLAFLREKEPSDPWLTLELAEYYAEHRGDVDAANRLYSVVTAALPDTPELWRRVAQLRAAAHDYRGAALATKRSALFSRPLE